MQRLESTPRRATFLSFQPPAVGDEEAEAVAETLRSGWLTSGPRAAELEERFAEDVGAAHAIALSSGTAALHLALVGLGVGPGDEVIVPAITWPATANVVVHTGATPVFVDVLEADLNIDPEAARAALTSRTKAIVPVHLAGAPADLDPLLELGVRVVEDAAHAVETVYRGRKVGSISDATAFSLYATKNVAAGEGGILTTDDDALAEAVLKLRLMRRGDGALYDVDVAGFKANLSDVLASLALVQLGKLEAHAEIRRRHFDAYDAGVADLDGIDPLARGEANDVHARHLYIVRIDPEAAGAGRDEYQRALAEENIGTSIHFLPVHLLTYYRRRFPGLRLPVAERAGSEVLSLPLSPAHSDEDVRDAIEALRRVHASFARAT
jgi:dTDP-4-amino-4,6-dideoxygalactose transaminase